MTKKEMKPAKVDLYSRHSEYLTTEEVLVDIDGDPPENVFWKGRLFALHEATYVENEGYSPLRYCEETMALTVFPQEPLRMETPEMPLMAVPVEPGGKYVLLVKKGQPPFVLATIESKMKDWLGDENFAVIASPGDLDAELYRVG